jgi:hypothetical protein
VRYILIGKQKIVLFPIFRENGWKAAENALMCFIFNVKYFSS